MIRKFAVCAAIAALLLAQRPHAQAAAARIFFVDIGQGAGTLVVSPTGRTLLVDGGPPGGGTKIAALLDTLGIATIDYTVLTHYHIDHDSGLTELLNAGRIAGIAFDNGDDVSVAPPGTSTSSTSTRGVYLNYVTATARPGVTRQTIAPGQVIDLGGGMRATCLVAGGRFLTGGSVPITTDDLNSESISLLIEYNDFDYLVSGDLTGGGSTSTAKSPDVETYAAQMAGDVDVVQLNHHGSTTASNQKFLSTVKAEVAVAQTGETNTFGHPNRETVNKYLNTPVTNGGSFGGEAIPTPGGGPVFYQQEDSPSGDDRVTHQGISSTPNPGTGTILLQTDGVTSYSISSFDDGGVRIAAASNTYPIDGASPGITTDFPPTVVVSTAPVVPLSTDATTVTAAVNDRESPIDTVTLTYSVNGAVQAPVTMTLTGGVYQATIPAQPDGTRVDYAVSGAAGVQSTTFTGGYFSGITPVASLRVQNAKGEPVYNGYTARIQAVVTAGSNTFGSGTNDDYAQDASGAINIYRSTDTATPFNATAVGQTVQVLGRVGFNGGRVRLDITESVEKSSSPFNVIVLPDPPITVTPAAVTIGAVNASPESFEGQIVSIANASIVSGSIPATPQTLDSFMTIGDGTGTLTLKVDHDTDIEGFNPGPTFTVVGIIQQDDYLRPFDSGYDIAPRGRVDLGGTAAGAALMSIADAKVDHIINADGTPGSDLVPDLLGQLVKVRGAVTSIDFRGGNGVEYYVQDPTGGIDLFNSTQNFGPFGIGDSVEAIGTVTHFNGLTELTLASMSLLPPGTIPAATPQLVTLSQLADGGAGEPLEGRLVRLDNITITSGTFPAAGASGNVTVTDATGSAVLRIDSDTNIDGTPTPSGPFSVTAVVGQFDTTSPFDSGYQLLPRSLADLVTSTPTLTTSPTTVDFGSIAVGGSASRPVTITNASSVSVTLNTPFTIAGTDPTQFSVGAPASTTLAAGASTSVSVSFAPTTSGAKSASLAMTGSGGASANVALVGTTPSGGGPVSPILISEFRTRGPSGGNDEFVELYNNSDAPAAIGGYKFKGSNNAGTQSVRATVPANTTVPARGHYLLVNNATGSNPAIVALGNQTYATGITDDGGIAITLADDTIVDAVGLSTGSAFKEGTVLTPLTTNTNQGYERKAGGVEGSQVDTNNNANDFQLKTPSDPQNLASTPTPAIAVTPTSVSFGSLAVGGSATATLTIRNLATTSVTLTPPFALTGPAASAFSVGAPASTTLAGGGTTTVVATFQPSTAGVDAATLTITSGGGTRTISLSGTATGGIALDASTLDFGALTPGSSAVASLTITNTDPDAVTLTPPFAITGTDAGSFDAGAPSATVLAPGDTASLAVGFVAGSLGPKSALLTVTSTTGGSRGVTLLGNVVCPPITISGALPNGVVGVAYSQTLTASGGPTPFTFTSTGAVPDGLTLDSGGSLSGTPTKAGSFDFTVIATAANGCSGTAPYTVAVTSAATITAAAPHFGVVKVGGSTTQLATITNTSGFAITLTPPFVVSGPDAGEFTAGSPAATALNPGASTTVPVTFRPLTALPKSASLDVTSSALGSASAPLDGTGSTSTASSTIVISELRFRGPTGGNDEFVEIYNNTDAAIDISGYRLLASNGSGLTSTRATVPAGRTIAPHGHYLFANSGYSGTPAADQTYATGITDDGGAAIALPDSTILDQVGLSSGSAFKEGTPLASLGTTNTARSYERRLGGFDGGGQDTDVNSADFVLRTASDPQNAASNGTPSISVTPSSVDFGSLPAGGSGSATITVTNVSGLPVTLAPPFTVSGTDAADFSAGAPGATSLSAGASTSFDVSFHPSALGGKSASVSVATDFGETRAALLGGTAICPAIALTPTLPNGTFGVSYNQMVTASGAEAPYTFVLAAGSLPSGLSVDSGGTIAGTPLAAGPASFTIRATATNGCSGEQAYSMSIARATVTITWPAPAAIVYGTALSAAQLNATAPIAGTFAYTPAAGTVLSAGASQTLNVSFTPSDASNYDASAAAVQIDVTTAPLSVAGANVTREFGAPNPPFTGSLTGARLEDHITATYSTTATPASALGPYPIVPQLHDPDGRLGNYAVSVTNGILTVVDTTAPVITVPSGITTAQTTVVGAPVTFTASASDLVDGSVPVACAPASGSTFPVGTTAVSCSAADAHGNNSSRSFNVTVTRSDTSALMVGAGVVAAGSQVHAFTFSVLERATGADTGSLHDQFLAAINGGALAAHVFDATGIAGALFSNTPGVSPGATPPSGIDTVVFAGPGTLDGAAGYTYEVRAMDAGEPGAGRDTFSIAIRDAAGHDVVNVSAVIGAGNIDSLIPPPPVATPSK